MTDKEIKKALECCGKNDCTDCPYREANDGYSCITELMEDVFELHKNQQEKIKKLQKSVLKYEDIFIEQQADIGRLTKECGNQSALWSKHYEDIFETAKETIIAEAIKEFVSEFEYAILHKEFWNDHPHTSQVWLNGYEQCMRDMRVMLKDKLKEMVGEDK